MTDAAEAHELVAPLGQAALGPRSTPRADHDDLSAVDLRVYDAVPLRRAATSESVARTAGLEVGDVAAALGRLELRGLVDRHGSGWHRMARTRA